MFDLSWAEILVLGLVGLIFIGPKDLPKALQALSKGIRALRRLTAEMQAHVEDLAKHADLREIGGKLRSEWQSFDLRDRLEKTLDPDRTLKNGLDGDLNLLRSPMTSASTSEAGTGSASMPLNAPYNDGVSAAALDERAGEDDYRARAAQQARTEEERRLSILAECPSILPPRSALRIHEERRRKMRPACLPPEVSIHGGRRELIAAYRPQDHRR